MEILVRCFIGSGRHALLSVPSGATASEACSGVPVNGPPHRNLYHTGHQNSLSSSLVDIPWKDHLAIPAHAI